MKLRNKKTGDIGELSVWYRADNKEIKEFGVIKENEKFPTDYKSLAELNKDWEDYEEPKAYWWIDTGSIPMVRKSNNPILSTAEDIDKEIGNYFETKEEAEKAVEKLKAWKRLKDKDFQFHGHNALGFGEITFSLDFEDMDDEGEIGQLRHDLDLLFSGEDD